MTRQRHNKNLNGYLQAVYQAQKCKHRSKESSYEGREKRAPMDSLSGLRRQDSGQSQRGYGPGTFPSVLPEMQTRYPDRPEGAKPTYRRARRLDAEPTTIEKSLSRCRLCFFVRLHSKGHSADIGLYTVPLAQDSFPQNTLPHNVVHRRGVRRPQKLWHQG